MRRFSSLSGQGALLALAVTVFLTGITGCGHSGTSAPISNPPTQTIAVLTLSATVLNFPTTTVGQTSAAQTLTLTNTGTATLTLSTVTVSNTTDFADTTTCGTSLAPGAICTFSITFKPSTAAALQSIITVTDNATNSPQSVTLNGTGVTAATPAVTLSPTSVAFASQTVLTTSAATTVTVTNTGNATLTFTSIGLNGANANNFTLSNSCPATLAPSAFCTLSVAFYPQTAASFAASIILNDNAANSPQTVALSGTGTATAAPAVTLSQTSVTFASQTAGTSSAATNVTLTNTGTATLSLSSIVLGGTNPADFTESNNCPSTLAAGAYCTLSVAFTPQAATGYSAMVTLTDNAGNVPNAQQGISLSGTGSAASTGGSVTYTLLTFPETDLSVTPLYALVNNAKTSIDMTMYELVDTTFSGDLVAACNRGVKVRVILDASLEKSSNTPAYNQLNAATNCSAAWSNTQFQATHQKSLIIDGSQLAVMSLNLTSRYYSTTRDFALLENDPADIAAVETTFLQDYQFANATSDYNYQPPAGTDLIWSPTTATADLLGIINGAKSTLLVENEEMSAPNIVSALEAACQRGVAVHIAMTDTGSYHANYTALEAAGCGVHTYVDNATTLYIHAKALLADYGLPTQSVYMGSINFSTASMTENRELGLYIADPTSVQSLATTMASDYAGASPF
jgi:HKD family nuclease